MALLRSLGSPKLAQQDEVFGLDVAIHVVGDRQHERESQCRECDANHHDAVDEAA